jgi:hypothetical protein
MRDILEILENGRIDWSDEHQTTTTIITKNERLAIAEIKKLRARIAERETALVDVTACLVAAVSLLERGGKKAAPSNKMFDQMIVDYKNCIERARAALKGGRNDGD